MKTKNSAKVKQGFRAVIANLAIVGILFGGGTMLTSCGIGATNNNNKTTGSGRYSGEPSVSMTAPATSEEDKILSKYTNVEENVKKTLGYVDFDYNYAMYTYEDETPVLKVNGDAIIDNNETATSITYNIDQDTYNSFVGLTIGVDRDENGKYVFSDDFSSFSEEEQEALIQIVEEITKQSPTSVKNMTYEEELHDVASYLCKKNNRVTITDIKYEETWRNCYNYFGKVYIEEKDQNSEGFVVNEYQLMFQQLQMYANTEEVNGNTEIHFNPDKPYQLQVYKSTKQQYTLNDEAYIRLYQKGMESDSRNSIAIENKVLNYMGQNTNEYKDGIAR
ncbi:MAG: hypothetical protein J6T74_05010 [Clostridia bacterium]|nr:hypothetical protein [Clostridia bacterium]